MLSEPSTDQDPSAEVPAPVNAPVVHAETDIELEQIEREIERLERETARRWTTGQQLGGAIAAVLVFALIAVAVAFGVRSSSAPADPTSRAPSASVAQATPTPNSAARPTTPPAAGSSGSSGMTAEQAFNSGTTTCNFVGTTPSGGLKDHCTDIKGGHWTKITSANGNSSGFYPGWL